MNRLVLIILYLSSLSSFAQQSITVETKDLVNFWDTFDRVRNETDSVEALRIIQRHYIDQGTKGLQLLMDSRKYKASDWYQIIRENPDYLAAVRPKTQQVLKDTLLVRQSLATLKTLYSTPKTPGIYFCVGILGIGATAREGQIIVGTELVLGDTLLPMHELPDFYKTVFTSIPKNMSYVAVHESVHTFQKNQGYGMQTPLLGHALQEGMCDFMAELVQGKDINFLPYLLYGRKHRSELWKAFKPYILSTASEIRSQWFYNSTDYPIGQADLGYFIGYDVCKAYYQRAKNKKKAIKEIIDLDTESPQAVTQFLRGSGYEATFIKN